MTFSLFVVVPVLPPSLVPSPSVFPQGALSSVKWSTRCRHCSLFFYFFPSSRRHALFPVLLLLTCVCFILSFSVPTQTSILSIQSVPSIGPMLWHQSLISAHKAPTVWSDLLFFPRPLCCSVSPRPGAAKRDLDGGESGFGRTSTLPTLLLLFITLLCSFSFHLVLALWVDAGESKDNLLLNHILH